MQSIVRGVFALGVAGALSGLALGRLVADSFSQTVGGDEPFEAASFVKYSFVELEIFDATVFRVDETYVDPSRLDWEKMFVAMLEAVEKHVPAAVFSREIGGSKVTVEVGEYLTVLEIAPVTTHRELIDATSQIATLLREHVDPDELPEGDPDVDDWQELEYAMVNGALHGALDPHSSLLPPRAASDMDVENQGQFGGLGVTIAERDGWLTVEFTRPGSPADAVGLKPDDRIVRIDGESTLNMTVDDAVVRLRGPEGAPVTLQIDRESREDLFEVDIVRAVIPLREVRGTLLDGGIGYIAIPGFHAEAESQLRRNLTRLKREAGGELKGLILDLRGNPGGFYHEGWKVADAFVEEGVLVSTVDRDGRQVDAKKARQSSTEPRYPMAVLVDPRSASASEIVAGALRNNDRAVIIGQRSFGKGSVQNLHEHVDGSKLKLTVSRYLTPGERSIQAVGIPADIALVPVHYDADGEPDRRLALHGWELDTREADLPGALDADALIADQPAYTLSYLDPGLYDEFGHPDAERDFEVGLARDVLLGAPSWRRAEILASAARVVSNHTRKSEAAVAQALTDLGLDWSDGPAYAGEGLPIEVTLEPASFPAGEQADLTLTARNTSEVPLHRVAALVTEHDVLAGREFLFGKLAPGESRSWTIQARAPRGYPGERSPVELSLRDGGPKPLGTARVDVEIEPLPRPALDWEIALVDDDGDGRAEVEERVRLEIQVKNRGEGASVGAVFRLLNRSGTALDLVKGNLSVGESVDRDGEPCDPEVRGTGRDGCRFVLPAGGTWSGVMELEVRDHPPEGQVDVDLRLERRADYDWAAIARAELESVYAHVEHIAIPVAAPLPDTIVRTPPRIQITHSPERVATGERVTISGVASDDSGLAHVMIFAGADKVFHQGSGRKSTLTQIPFTADVELEPGVNTLVVQAVDRDGVVWTESVVTWSGASELARVGPK